MSVPRALLLVLALLQAVGIIDLVRRDNCEEQCKRDGCPDDCTPGDDSPACACHCPSTTSVKPPAVDVVTTAPIAETLQPASVRGARLHASPDPREILHVPRHRVA